MKSIIMIMITTAVASIGWSAAIAADATPPNPAQVGRGREVFQYWCATCHGAGPGRPGTEALAVKYQGTVPALLEARNDLIPELIRHYVRHGVAKMPHFRKTEVSDADLDALCVYLVQLNSRPNAKE